MQLPDELVALLALQEGLVSRRQLRQAGFSDATVRWQLGRRWRLALPGVVATFTGTPTARQRLIAAQLYAGPDGVITSWTAAAWHGIGAARGEPLVRMAVPGNQSSRTTSYVRITRTTRPDAHPWVKAPLSFASRGRAVIEAACEVGVQERATAIVIEAVQRRLVTLESLRHELEARSRRGSQQARTALAAAEAGAWSVPELELLTLAHTSDVLPEVWPNPELFTPEGHVLPSPDLWVDEVGLAVQMHSRRYHSDPDQWDATVVGDGVLAEHDVLVLGVTPRLVSARPADVLRRIERSYLARVGLKRPDVVARPRLQV